jgi:hypothetical protein
VRAGNPAQGRQALDRFPTLAASGGWNFRSTQYSARLRTLSFWRSLHLDPRSRGHNRIRGGGGEGGGG